VDCPPRTSVHADAFRIPHSRAPFDRRIRRHRQCAAARHHDIDIDVDPHERRLEIRDAASGWPLIDPSIDEAGFLLVTTLGPTQNAMLDSIGHALSAIGAPWRSDDA